MKTMKVLALGIAAVTVAAATCVPIFWKSHRGVQPLPLISELPTDGGFDREQSAALFVGVREFSNGDILEVPYAVDDAVDLAYMFALDRRLHLVPPERAVLLLSGKPVKPESRERLEKLRKAGAKIIYAPTQPNIITQLQHQTATAGRNGILIVSFATHGFVQKGIPYILGSTSLFRFPETSVSLPRIYDITDGTLARRSLLFFDACRERITGGARGPADPMTAAPPLTRRMTPVIGQATFYAAPAGGYAYDHPSGNGVFTKAVLDGLACKATAVRGVITVETLRTFVEREVRTWIKQHQDPSVGPAIQVTLDGGTDNMPLSCCFECVPTPGSPHHVGTKPAGVVVFDENNTLLWEWQTPEPIVHAEVADLDGDGPGEIVVGAGGRIIALDRHKKQLWATAEESETLRTFVAGNLLRKPTHQIVALFENRATIYSQEGQVLATYPHPDLQQVMIGRPTNHHAPKIILSTSKNIILLHAIRGTEGWYGAGAIRALFDSAIVAARTAVRLDPELGEARAALGFGLCCTGRWQAGLRECEQAVRLSPEYFLAHDWLAIPLSALGRFDEALAAMDRAKILEPLSTVVHHHEAWVNVMAGRFGDAARAATQALELDGHYSFGWWWLGIAQTELGQTEDAVRSLERAQAIFGDFQLGHSALGHAYGRAGRREEALTCLQALRRSDPDCADPYHLALVHAGLGESNDALAALTEASDASSTWLRIYGPHDPRLNVLRGDPRLEDLLRRSATEAE